MDISADKYKVVPKHRSLNIDILKRVKGFFVRMIIGILGLEGEKEL